MLALALALVTAPLAAEFPPLPDPEPRHTAFETVPGNVVYGWGVGFTLLGGATFIPALAGATFQDLGVGYLVVLGLGGLSVLGGVGLMSGGPLANQRLGARRYTGIPGYVGATLFTVGLGTFTWSLLDDGVVGWAPFLLMASGPVFGTAQVILDTHALHHAPVEVAVVPTLRRGGGGLTLAARF